MYILRIGDRFAYSGGLRDGIDHRLRVHLRRAFLRPVEQEFSRIGTSDSRRRVNLKVRARDRSGDCPHPCPDTAYQFSLTVDARFHHSVRAFEACSRGALMQTNISDACEACEGPGACC